MRDRGRWQKQAVSNISHSSRECVLRMPTRDLCEFQIGIPVIALTSLLLMPFDWQSSVQRSSLFHFTDCHHVQRLRLRHA